MLRHLRQSCVTVLVLALALSVSAQTPAPPSPLAGTRKSAKSKPPLDPAGAAKRAAAQAAAREKLNAELLSAIENDDVSRAKTLLAKKADPNASDKHKVSVLMMAVEAGDAELVKLLLAAKADVNAGDDSGTTALITAAEFGDVELMPLLLDAKTGGAKADINAADVNRWTA